MSADVLWTNARLWTGAGPLIESGAVAAEKGRIAYVGPAQGAPAAARIVDCEGRLVTPGLIDCHTHIVHAGNRADEWRMRLEGATYEEVARAGGGIALLPTFLAGRDVASGALVRVLPGVSLQNAPVFVVNRRQKPLPPRVAALRSFLLEARLFG